MRLTAKQRLRKSSDFKRFPKNGLKWECRAFLCRCIPAGGDSSLPIRRLGVIASKRVGNAVNRNHAKRLFRELFRINQELLPANCDVIVVARVGVHDCSFQELTTQFLKACRVFNKQGMASK